MRARSALGRVRRESGGRGRKRGFLQQPQGEPSRGSGGVGWVGAGGGEAELAALQQEALPSLELTCPSLLAGSAFLSTNVLRDLQVTFSMHNSHATH